MSDPDANLVNRLYEKVGAALELASTTDEPEDQAYWLGMADCAIELIAEETGETYASIKADVSFGYDQLSLEDRVNEVFGG